MLNLSIFEQAGIDVQRQDTISNIFDETGLNWQVTQHIVESEYGRISNVLANYRSDNRQFLGFVHPKTYKVVQNNEAFDFIDELDNFTVDKVGTFNNGKKVFVIGKTNEKIAIDGNDDLIDFYMTFLHGHDGKSGIRFILCPIRMFCMNQMNLMLKTSIFKYNITHTGNVEQKLIKIKRAINESQNYVTDLQLAVDKLVNTKPDKTIKKFVEQLIPIEELDSKITISRKEEERAEIVHLYNNKDDLQNYKNTEFGYISAVSDFISHRPPIRTKNRSNTINNLLIRNFEGNELLKRANDLLLAA